MLSFRMGALIVFMALKAFSQETIVNLDHVWRYEGSGGDLGTAWREAAYDDSAWPQGPGVLAIEDNPVVTPLTNTVLTRIGTNGAYKTIDYFRTRFQVSDVRPGYFFSAAVLVDDGAVVYLNGAELFRVRMPAGPITANTLATETIDVGREGVFVTTNVASSALQLGENVLAVEVHQPYVTSTDTTWGMVLTYAPMEPVSIVEEPQERTIEEGKSATNSVKVRGTLPRFQWWKGTQLLPGETNAGLSMASVSRTNAGLYWVSVSNEVSVVASRLAALTVVLDREPPRLLSAEVAGDVIYAHFSEALDPVSATDLANFRLLTSGGTTIPITQAFDQPHLVILDSPPLTPGAAYYLFVSNVRDRYGNVIAPDSGVSILSSFTNIPVASVWKYNDAGLAPDSGWNQLDYDDAAWPSGAALLYNDANLSLQPPAVRNTLVQVTNVNGPIVTHYFRLPFVNNVSPIGSSLQLSAYIDDGAVFYLNGREIFRFNMPQGAIDHLTRASASGNEGSFNTGANLSGTNLLAGRNVLAVEVHQFSLQSPNFPDISFAVQSQARAESLMNGLPVILLQPGDQAVSMHDRVVFHANVAGAASVQWTRDGNPIDGATQMSYTNCVRCNFISSFALIASNAFGMVTSRVARLTVFPDLQPPRLLSARMGTNVDRIEVAFSEPIESFHLVMGNFTITNELGAPLEILQAELVNLTKVVLTTQPRSAGVRYTLVARDIFDWAMNRLPDGVIGIEYEDVIIRYDSVWKYDDSGTNFSNAWHEPPFDDSAWPQGPGLLGFEDSRLLPLPILTMLPPPEFRGPAYFFRTRFTFSGDPSDTVLRLRHIVDDGVVVFLNGQEVHRARVPIGQNAGTIAESAIQDGTIEGPFTISSGALVNGVNVLAAQVHQVTVTSADSVFGLELVQPFLPDPPGPTSPQLDFEWRGDELVFSWDAWDFVLESAPSVAGPWVPVSQPTIPHTVAFEDSARFFRLKKNP